MVSTTTVVLISIGIALVLSLIIWAFAVSSRWVLFGLRLWWADYKYKKKTGLLWVIDNSGNLGFPRPINLATYREEIGDNTYHWLRKQLDGLRFLGRPFLFYDNDDSKTTKGVYKVMYQDCKKDAQDPTQYGEPEYYVDDEGEYYTDEEGNPIPKLISQKPSVTLPPNFHQSLVAQEALQAMKSKIYDILDKYKYVFMIVAGIGIGIAVIFYLLYNIQSTQIPELISTAEAAKTACEAVMQPAG